MIQWSLNKAPKRQFFACFTTILFIELVLSIKKDTITPISPEVKTVTCSHPTSAKNSQTTDYLMSTMHTSH